MRATRRGPASVVTGSKLLVCSFFSQIEGDYFAILGLPLLSLLAALREHGVIGS